MGYTHVVGYLDVDLASSLSNRQSTSCIVYLLEEISYHGKVKKKNVVVKSSVETEYHAMTLVTWELVWLKQLTQELKFADISQISLLCDNQNAFLISSNPIFHEGQST